MERDDGVLSVREVAAVTGVSPRDIHHAIDSGLLPAEVVTRGGARGLDPLACVIVDLDRALARTLTREARETVHRSLALARDTDAACAHVDLGIAGVAVDPTAAFAAARAGLERLSEARAMVERRDDVLGGAPVVRGTRIPVHDVAANREAGASDEAIIGAYPSLTRGQIDLAVLFAKAYPLRGRPRRPARPAAA